MNSTNARPIVVEALRRVKGREPELAEVYVLQALARFDGGYGNYSSPPHGPEGPTSNNWGAVQDRANFSQYVQYSGITNPDRNAPEVKAFRSTPAPPSPKPSEFFYASDFQPGKGWFWGPYKVYPNPVDGAAHVAQLLESMGVLEVARTKRNWMAVSRQLREKHYYLGFHPENPEIDIRDYARNLQAGGNHFAELFGEESPLGWDSDPKAEAAPRHHGHLYRAVGSDLSSERALPTLRIGCSGPAVELWQRLLNEDPKRGITLDVDGDFGPITEKTTRHWQSRRKLVVDGVVGRKSWRRMP